ncbi:MAG: LysM domain-containing protein [Oscillospiraceae bacterium]|nr:LysM domain-containing protein [Oscillospiraceae bacterium]
MNCPRQLTYVISQGDNLYQLSRHYQTSVSAILALNPGINPYNLQIGAKITICPGEGSSDTHIPGCPNFEKQLELMNAMRLAWSQHVYWTRMLLISIADRLPDLDAVTARLMQNPGDIAKIFAGYYTKEVADAIATLLTEHLQIGAELITALRDGETAQAETLNHQWYENADKMAAAFSGISPYYQLEDMRDMLYRHLGLTTQEVVSRLSGDYPADIKAFDTVEEEALMMADAFSSGLMRQFPQMFI